MGVAPTPRATADSTAQEGAERDRSPQDWSAGHSPVGGTGVSGRAACGWDGGAWEAVRGRCPTVGVAGSRPACAGKGPWGGALGRQGEAAHSGVPSRNTGLDSSSVPLAPSAGDA